MTPCDPHVVLRVTRTATSHPPPAPRLEPCPPPSSQSMTSMAMASGYTPLSSPPSPPPFPTSTTLSLANLDHFSLQLVVNTGRRSLDPRFLWSYPISPPLDRVLGHHCCYLHWRATLQPWRPVATMSVAWVTSAPCPTTPWSHRRVAGMPFWVSGRHRAAI
jgi:hypothetical protein